MMKRFTLTLFTTMLFMLAGATASFSQNLNLIANGDFEKVSLTGWSADSCLFESHKAASHAGKRSLVFRPLKEGAGIQLDVSQKIQPDFTYVFSAWFRNAELGWGQADVLLRFQQNGQTRETTIGRVDCDKQGWKELSGPFVVEKAADPSSLELVLKTAWGQNAFLVDDLVVRPALQVGVQCISGMDAPDLFLQIGPENALRKGLKGHLGVFAVSGNSVESSERPLNAAVRLPLKPGFYRVTASLKDLDGRVFDAEKTVYSGALPELKKNLENSASAVIDDASLEDYRGWIQYLCFLESFYSKQDGNESDRALQAAFRLDQWIAAVRANPQALEKLTGVQEWAYSSRADDTGQPFKIAIPTNYDSRKPYPLVVVMHGYGGNHLEYSGGVTSNPDYFEIDVLGRARGGGYNCLSEADVLDAVDYVQAHWNIDERKIHLTGASMGGGGTFKLASRYPDRWASGRPVCGYGSDQPVLNALHVPLYSTHSQDDPTVPVLASRAPLLKLLNAGGRVIMDETNGLQHAAWNYVDGNRRGQEWFVGQVRSDFREVRRIDYTAVDRKASRAYWLQIEEWGKEPGSARFRAEAGGNNELYLVLENIQTLRIAVPESPLNRGQNLRVSVNGGIFTDVPAPLPDSLFVNWEKGIWSVNTTIAHRTDFALRTSGGIYNLYAGEPLLIVYGTSGDDSSNAAMARAAEAASKSMNPMWVGDGGDVKDGVPSHHILYGRLKFKPDTSVTAQDIAKCNLLLIGRADENRLVAKMADRLPVKFAEEIVCSDGVQMPRDRAMLGLYYYNPLAPRRLIYWVAADQPASYRPYPFLLQIQNDSPVGTDLLVVQDNPPKIVRCRQFDSRWNWSTAFEQSAVIEAKDATFGSAMNRVAESMRKAVGADYTLLSMSMPPQFEILSPGITHWLDVALLDMTTSLAVVELNGAELAALRKETLKSGSGVQLLPASDNTFFSAEKTYRVVMSASFDKMQQVIRMLNRVPSDFTNSDVTLFEAMKQTLF